MYLSNSFSTISLTIRYYPLRSSLPPTPFRPHTPIFIFSSAHTHFPPTSTLLTLYLYFQHISHQSQPELFYDGTGRYGVPGNENEECRPIFCLLVLHHYHGVNYGVPGPFREKE